MAFLITAAVLAVGRPALAQDWREGPPPMPPMREHVMPMPMPMHGDHASQRPLRMDGQRFGYSPEARDAWLDECYANFRGPDPRDEWQGRRRGAPMVGHSEGGAVAYCDDYLEHYERAMVNPQFGPQFGQEHPPRLPFGSAPAYVTPGYIVPPLLWVRVPIIRERRGCDCGKMIEREVVSPPARRWMPRHPSPRLRSTK